MTIKNIITETYFRKEYKYNGVVDNDEDRITTENIEFYIGRGSSRVNTILSRAVDKGITAGIYTIPDGGNLEVVDAEFADAAELAEEKTKVEAIKEAVAILTKFGIDTGWDFVTGSFSASIGTESFSDTTDFESSVTRVETNVKELLANFDFGNLLVVADSFRIALDTEDTPEDAVKPGFVSHNDRTLTEAQLVTRLVDPIWTEGRNGIKLYPKDATQPSKGIIIELDNATLNKEAATDELNEILTERFKRDPIPTATVDLSTYVRIISELFDDLESYTLTLKDADDKEINVSLKDALEELQAGLKLVGSYADDDGAGELDHDLTVIRNVVIIRENQIALDKRITANFDKIETKENIGVAKQLADQALVEAKAADAVVKAEAEADATAKADAAQAAAKTESDKKVPIPAVAGKTLTSKADGSYELVDPGGVDLTPYRTKVDQDVKDAAELKEAKDYADSQIAAIPPVINPLLKDYEALHIFTGNGTFQIPDFATNLNDFVIFYNEKDAYNNQAKFNVLPETTEIRMTDQNIEEFRMTIETNGKLTATVVRDNHPTTIYRRKK